MDSRHSNIFRSALGCQQQTDDVFVHQTSVGARSQTSVRHIFVAGQHQNPVKACHSTSISNWTLEEQHVLMPMTGWNEVPFVDWHHISISNWHHTNMAEQCRAAILDWYKTFKAEKQQTSVTGRCAAMTPVCLLTNRADEHPTVKAEHTKTLMMDLPRCSNADWHQVSMTEQRQRSTEETAYTSIKDCHQKPISHQSQPLLAGRSRSIVSDQRHQAMLERRRIAKEAAMGSLAALVNRNSQIVTRDDTTIMHHGNIYIRPRKRRRFLREGDKKIKVNYEEIDPHW